MKKNNKKEVKRWVISSLITFVTSFVITLLAQWDGITLDSIVNGGIVGILFTAGRAGLKAVFEAFLLWKDK